MSLTILLPTLWVQFDDFLAIVRNHLATTTIRIWRISTSIHYPTKFPRARWSSELPIEPLLQEPATLITVVWPFLEFDVNGTVQRVVFHIRLLSLTVKFLRFIYVELIFRFFLLLTSIS